MYSSEDVIKGSLRVSEFISSLLGISAPVFLKLIAPIQERDCCERASLPIVEGLKIASKTRLKASDYVSQLIDTAMTFF